MSTALQIHEPSTPLAVDRPRLGLLRPIATPAEIITSQEEARSLVTEALKEGRDYGKIPGVDKPSLLKPGAERLNLAFGCVARFRVAEREFDHDRPVPWRKSKAIYEGPKGNRRKVGEEVTEGTSLGLYRYVVECELVHRESGTVVAACLGSCSTMESKYIDRPRDCENTVIKMAEKRALVGATLLAYGLSEQFTQDVEDLPREAVSGAAAAADDEVKCPKCSGSVWDNREKNDEREKAGKKRMPDYKCKDAKCEHVIWDAAKHAADLATQEGEQRPDPTAAATTGVSPTSSTPTSSTEASPAASEFQVSKILELCDHVAIEEQLAESIRARLARGVTTARADELLVGLETKIRAATPAPVPVKPDATVAQPQGAADSAHIHAQTKRLNELLKSDRIAQDVQKRVSERLAAVTELTPELLDQAVHELENVEIPF